MPGDITQMPTPAAAGAGPAQQASPNPQVAGGVPSPMSGGSAVPVAALGRQAETRNKLRAVVMILQRDALGAFEFNSDEGQAIYKALQALGPMFGGGAEEEKNKNSAMLALRQRAMQQRGMGQDAMAGGGMPQPNTGPIPMQAAQGAMAA